MKIGRSIQSPTDIFTSQSLFTFLLCPGTNSEVICKNFAKDVPTILDCRELRRKKVNNYTIRIL